MKTQRLITAILSALCVAGVLLMAHFCLAFKQEGQKSPAEVSQYCERYGNRDDITISFIKDKHLNDSSVVDVTVIEPKNFAAWNWVVHEFATRDADFDWFGLRLQVGHAVADLHVGEPGRPWPPTVMTEGIDDLVVLSHSNTTCYIFHANSREQCVEIYIKALKSIVAAPTIYKTFHYYKHNNPQIRTT